MRRLFMASAFLLIVRSAAAQPEPALVAITPAAGPTAGGTTVTITITPGSYSCGIDPCTGPVLLIGGVSVPYTGSSTTLTAVTPPHPPGAVSIELRPGIGGIGAPSVLTNAFLYQGNDIPALSFPVAALLAVAVAAFGALALRGK